MNRFSLTVFSTILTAVIGASMAAAQTPANLTIVEGSGQLVCLSCSRLGDVFLNPLAARVTDATGNPIVNYAVNWSISGALDANLNASTTYTDSTGTATALPFVPITQALGFGTFFNQATVVATAGNATASFIVTNGLADQNGNQGVYINFSQPPASALAPLSGNVGGTAAPFSVQVYTLGSTPVAGVSVRLINWADGTSGPSPSAPSAYCQTGTGADLWSVLTDSTGLATCTPKLGPVAGSGQVAILVGGTPAGIWLNGAAAGSQPLNPDNVMYNPTAVLPQTPLPAFGGSGAINITVNAVSVGGIQIVSGNSQSAAPGQALTQTLVATVTDSSGNPLPSQPVQWSISPAASGQLTNPSTASDSNGRVTASLTFSAAASGTVSVNVKSGSASATFTETAVPTIVVSGLTKVSGDGQSAAEGAAFAIPLIVMATVNSGSVANQTVTFTVTGGAATFTSSATPTTANNGQAQVTVKAGATAGAVTITASAGSSLVTFSLTVSPPAPPISATSFVNAADSKAGSISPCSLGTIVASGLMLQDGSIGVGQLPYQFNGVTIGFNTGDLAPIQSILTNSAGQTSITFQVPCDLAAGTVPVVVNVNGSPANASVTVLPSSPGIYSTLMSDGKTRAVILRPDGSFVSVNSNPARRGENVTAFVTGLGPVTPGIGTNGLPIPGTPSMVQGQVIIGINNAGVPVTGAQLTTDRIGVYQVSFQIPQDAPQGNDVVFSVGLLPAGSTTANYSIGSSIPIQ